MSWIATGLLMMIAFGGLATLIVLALRDRDVPLRQPIHPGQAEPGVDPPSEVHHA